ncbi:MAG TPA: histidine--tRNA ligase [Steroidobacteraceae bacterium]|nr:histidine--tRNA ligase [Steroidobacteraceae bacterium]HRX88085.1 histidine--tRNA ligase [Steroidobacteraceae bacterium]
MTNQIQPVRGMNDVLTDQIAVWQFVEQTAADLLTSYGYEEMRVPVVEHTQLFKRAIGEFTDVVEKEMYTFTDLGGDSLTLRPEATAGMVRAAISNGLLRGARLKVWCVGPMFRHEKPQKGRYRQFHQVDVEAIGFPGPDVDIELIALTARLWRRLGVARVKLQINSLGTAESRRQYRELLQAYFRGHLAVLDADSQRRLDGNPLRILDSKNPEMQAVIAGAPLLTEHLDAESAAHFVALRAGLDALSIPYTINPRLVRGLDYYSRTVFEWTTDALGSQDAVCSGGRYDGLINQLGGDATPAIGFAMGVERVVELVRLAGAAPAGRPPDVYVIAQGDAATRAALVAAEQLRSALPQRSVHVNLGGGNFKAQFRRADKSGAAFALIIGDDEIARGVAAWKPLRGDGAQLDMSLAELPAQVRAALTN